MREALPTTCLPVSPFETSASNSSTNLEMEDRASWVCTRSWLIEGARSGDTFHPGRTGVSGMTGVSIDEGAGSAGNGDAGGVASVPTDDAGQGKVLSGFNCADVSTEARAIEGVGISANEGTVCARDADDGSEDGAVSNAGGTVSVPTDCAGHGKVPSFSDGVLQKHDHINAIVVEGAAASVIVAAETVVTTEAAVATVSEQIIVESVVVVAFLALVTVSATVLVGSTE
jgi:hypothetical protein